MRLGTTSPTREQAEDGFRDPELGAVLDRGSPRSGHCSGRGSASTADMSINYIVGFLASQRVLGNREVRSSPASVTRPRWHEHQRCWRRTQSPSGIRVGAFQPEGGERGLSGDGPRTGKGPVRHVGGGARPFVMSWCGRFWCSRSCCGWCSSAVARCAELRPRARSAPHAVRGSCARPFRCPRAAPSTVRMSNRGRPECRAACDVGPCRDAGSRRGLGSRRRFASRRLGLRRDAGSRMSPGSAFAAGAAGRLIGE